MPPSNKTIDLKKKLEAKQKNQKKIKHLSQDQVKFLPPVFIP